LTVCAVSCAQVNKQLPDKFPLILPAVAGYGLTHHFITQT
jgi:hypothetical protein